MAEQQTVSTPGRYSLQLWCRLCLPEGERDCKPSPGCPILERSPLGSGVPEGTPRGGWQGTAALVQQAAGAQLRVPPVPLPSPPAELSWGREEGNEHPSQGKGPSFTRSGTTKETSKTKYKKPPLASSRPCFVRFLFYFLAHSGAVRSGVQGKLPWRAGAVQCCVMSPGAAFQNRKDAEFSPEQKSGVNALTY